MSVSASDAGAVGVQSSNTPMNSNDDYGKSGGGKFDGFSFLNVNLQSSSFMSGGMLDCKA